MENWMSGHRKTQISEADVFFSRVNGKKLSQKHAFRLIDLFAGAGGLSLGFSSRFGHNFQPVWANDTDQSAAATYNVNFGQHCQIGDIETILRSRSFTVPKADVVIGGPPCQGFSLLNKDREGDARRQLWKPFLDIVKRSGAEVFVMENVPQLLGTDEHASIEKAAKSMGFGVVAAKLCAADYGVPQVRYRAFIVGSKVSDPKSDFPPKKTHIAPANRKRSIQLGFGDGNGNGNYLENPEAWRTLRDVIWDLPNPAGTEIRDVAPPMDLHFGRRPTETSLLRYKAIPKEGMNRFDLQRLVPELTPACWIRKKSGGTDLFGRLWWDRPAFTIRTEFFKPEKGRYLHPSEHRPITHREAARIQSFPDDFRFVGTKIEIAKQIGNAVPPMMAARVADCVYALLLHGKK